VSYAGIPMGSIFFTNKIAIFVQFTTPQLVVILVTVIIQEIVPSAHISFFLLLKITASNVQIDIEIAIHVMTAFAFLV
jgi:hypothetical protein